LIDKSLLLLGFSAIAVIIFAIVIVSVVENSTTQPAFSKIVTVGPVWATDSWQCTSNSDFLIHGFLRGFEGAMFAINVSNIGTQSLYTFLNEGTPIAFTVGAEPNQGIVITRTGTVTGFITLQTNTGATASCIPI
jgi:hypothetical protein